MAVKSTVPIKTEEVAMERASWTSWMRAGRVERESGTGCARRGLERERFLKTNRKSRLAQRFGLGSLLALSRSWGRSRSRESPRREFDAVGGPCGEASEVAIAVLDGAIKVGLADSPEVSTLDDP